MSEPMMITQEMKDSRKMEVDKRIERVNDRIKSAVERNQHSACFPISKENPFYAEIRQKFERAGYTIKPTGYIGGVWQLTEDICW